MGEFVNTSCAQTRHAPRLPFGSRNRQKQSSKHGQNRKDNKFSACIGPSSLHNLLPILEYLNIVDPKLQCIENRIIGRQRQHYAQAPFKLPSNFDQLKSWVEKASISCDCDQCAPYLYKLSVNTSHNTVQYTYQPQGDISKGFRYRHEIHKNPHPQLKYRFYGDYEAMHLARAQISWLNQTHLEASPPKPDASVLQLQSLLETWKPHLTYSDLRQSMSRTQLVHLFNLLNKIFFFGAIPSHRSSLSTGFSWLPETLKDCFGIGSFNPIMGTQILLHPILYRGQNIYPRDHPEDVDLRWRNRLGTILHEMCHAFLKAYTCRACPTYDVCMGARGHGRAWQVMAAKIEEVATRLLGGFVDLGRYPSLLSEVRASGKLPSSHDLEVYRFDERWESWNL